MKAYSLHLLAALTLLTALLHTANAQDANDALLLEYYQGQRYSEAAIYLKGLYKEPVNDAVALRNLAYTSQMAGKLVDAENYYQRLFSMDTTKLSVLNSLAGINQRRGNVDKALGYYKRIVAVDTANFYVLKQLAMLSFQKMDIPAYVLYLTKANNINPEEADVAADLSSQLVLMKQYAYAEKVLNKATAADPENMELLQSLINLTYEQKKWPETIETGIHLIKLGDGTYPTISRLGKAYYQLKNYTCCIETLASLQGNQQNENSYYYTAMSYKALKNYKKAVENFELAIKDGISPSIATYYGEMAGSYQENKQVKKAVTAYQKGLQFGDSPMIFYSLATLYDSDLKDKKKAVKYYKMFLGTNPSVKQQALVDYSKSRLSTLK
jgi:tetratricopeptide (TPR) repeat protein